MIRFGDFLKVSTMSVALLSGAVLTVNLVAPDAAYAGKGNGKDNGNGNGNGGSNGKGNSGGHGVSGGDTAAKGKAVGKGNGGSRGKSVASRDPIRSITDMLRGKSSDAKTKGTVKRTAKKSTGTTKKAATTRAPKVTAAPASKPRGNPLARELGVHPSELGALNAAHASPNALANASPNSRVGKLAIYMGEVEVGRELVSDLEAAEAELATLDAPTRSQEEIDAEIEASAGEQSALEGDLAALQQALADAGGEDADISAEIASVQAALDEKAGEIAGLEQERADGEAYALASEEVERIEIELETQELDQRAALEDAANKPVTDEVEAAVQKLLGIYEEPEVVEDEEVIIVIEDEVAVAE